MEDNIIIMNKKFELFLNTVHYCLWLGDRKFGDFMGKVVNVLLSLIPKYLFTDNIGDLVPPVAVFWYR